MTREELFEITSDSENVAVIDAPGFLFELIFTSENAKAKGYKFVNCTFNDPVHFLDVNIGGGIFFENCTFNSLLKFSQVSSNQNDFTLGTDSISIKFIDTKIENKLIVENGYVDRNISFENSVINGLQFQHFHIQQGGINFKGCTIESNFDFRNYR